MPSAVPPMKELSVRGQICAFAVSSNVVPPAVKNSDWRLAYCAGVMRSRPVTESRTAPVAAEYRLNASMRGYVSFMLSTFTTV